MRSESGGIVTTAEDARQEAAGLAAESFDLPVDSGHGRTGRNPRHSHRAQPAAVAELAVHADGRPAA